MIFIVPDSDFKLHEWLGIGIALLAVAATFYAAFLGARYQIKLYVMKILAVKAGECNAFWHQERSTVSTSEHIKNTITVIIRTIQVVDRIMEEHSCLLERRARRFFIDTFYLQLDGSIHNLLLDPLKTPAELFANETDEGLVIIASWIATLREILGASHAKYARKANLTP